MNAISREDEVMHDSAAKIADALNKPLVGKPGRRTKREEIADFLELANLDPEYLKLLKDAQPAPKKPPEPTPEPPPPPRDESDPPEDWSEWEAEMMRLLWQSRHELKGVALPQTLKAITELAKHQREREAPDAAEDTRRPLLDRLDALPPEHAATLVKREIERLDALRVDYFAALERLEAT